MKERNSARGMERVIEMTVDHVEEPPHRIAFLGTEREEVRLVPARDNQRVPRTQREGIGERGGGLVLGEEITALQATPEEVVHRVTTSAGDYGKRVR